ncbi:MAG: hypothetical protein PPP56_08875 [Longimonas sp.]|uniref:hypothetical protein n=1 Tax=Longimonas sp. TaxID=2039626 RepID=UPI00334D9EB9
MTLDDFITTVFCVTDDFMQAALGGGRLRKRGPRPTVPDSVVVTCELVGEFLGYDTDSGIYRYIRRHHLSGFFTGLVSGDGPDPPDDLCPASGEPLDGQRTASSAASTSDLLRPTGFDY